MLKWVLFRRHRSFLLKEGKNEQGGKFLRSIECTTRESFSWHPISPFPDGKYYFPSLHVCGTFFKAFLSAQTFPVLFRDIFPSSVLLFHSWLSLLFVNKFFWLVTCLITSKEKMFLLVIAQVLFPFSISPVCLMLTVS